MPNGALTYIQSSGIVQNEVGKKIAQGWAGNHAGRNNPDMQDHVGLGPLPQGKYRFGPWGDHETVPGYPKHLGPLISSLTQIEGETYGRSSFYMHGPGGADPSQSSMGCIEIFRPEREIIRSLDPEFLEVVRG
jgi:hypothetical protein